jgi:AraC family transcriptional regulator of arabinose operon
MTETLNDSIIPTVSPPPGILVAGRFAEQHGYRTYRPKGTRDWLITATREGVGEYRTASGIWQCREGDVILLAPGTPHHYATPEGETWHFDWCHFIPKPEWLSLLHLPELSPGVFHVRIDSLSVRTRLGQAFERMRKDSLGPEALSRQLALNAMEEILLLIAKYGNHQKHLPSLDSRVEEVLRILTQNMREQHSIPKLAKAVSLSPSRLSGLFKKEVGESILETLLQIRLRHAARQLEYTTRPIAEIAADVGFRSPFYFTKQFTAFYGMSPSAYRMRRQNEAESSSRDE